MQKIISDLFEKFENIRYVAIYQNNKLIKQQRPSISDSSASETDTYEELLVNPTLLKLLSQRANIDCGGLRHVVIAYGHFCQLVQPINNGHISIAIEKKADIQKTSDEIFDHLIRNHQSIYKN